MSPQEIANEFVKRYRSTNPFSKYELYAEHCVSIESPKNGHKTETIGLENIKIKGQNFYKQFDEVTKREVGNPVVNENSFSVNFSIHGTKNNKPLEINEVALYSIENGKITSEEFIY